MRRETPSLYPDPLYDKSSRDYGLDTTGLLGDNPATLGTHIRFVDTGTTSNDISNFYLSTSPDRTIIITRILFLLSSYRNANELTLFSKILMLDIASSKQNMHLFL